MVLLGSHVSMSGKKMLLGSAEEAASYNAETFMIYTGAPQNTRRKLVEEMNIPQGTAFMAENNLSKMVVHAPYIKPYISPLDECKKEVVNCLAQLVRGVCRGTIR